MEERREDGDRMYDNVCRHLLDFSWKFFPILLHTVHTESLGVENTARLNAPYNNTDHVSAVHLQVRHTPTSCRRRSVILGSVEWGQMKMGPSRCKRPPGYYGGTGGREVGGERRVRGRGLSLFSMLRMCYFILRSRLRKRRPSNA